MSGLKDLSGVPQLEKDNYQEWSRKINAYFRFQNLFNLVHGKETRPSDTADQPDWDKRAMQAAGAIEMTLDQTNATHVHGIEGEPVLMWKQLESAHNSRTPGSRFNAMDTFFSIKKEENEDLSSLVTRVKAAMQHVQSLRPIGTTSGPTVTVSSTSGSTTTTLYTLKTLDEELIIMALLRALPEDYSALRSSLFIQDTLTLQMVETAFSAEDNQRKHTTRENITALRAAADWRHSNRHKPYSPPRSESTPPSTATSSSGSTTSKKQCKCYFCKNLGHIERDCRIKKAAQQNYLTNANANIASESIPDGESSSHDEFAALGRLAS